MKINALLPGTQVPLPLALLGALGLTTSLQFVGACVAQGTWRGVEGVGGALVQSWGDSEEGKIVLSNTVI